MLIGARGQVSSLTSTRRARSTTGTIVTRMVRTATQRAAAPTAEDLRERRASRRLCLPRQKNESAPLVIKDLSDISLASPPAMGDARRRRASGCGAARLPDARHRGDRRGDLIDRQGRPDDASSLHGPRRWVFDRARHRCGGWRRAPLRLGARGRHDAAPGLLGRQAANEGREPTGERRLCKLFALGAATLTRNARSRADRASEWQQGVLARRLVKVAVMAQAAKTTRIAWAVLTSGKTYAPKAAA